MEDYLNRLPPCPERPYRNKRESTKYGVICAILSSIAGGCAFIGFLFMGLGIGPEGQGLDYHTCCGLVLAALVFAIPAYLYFEKWRDADKIEIAKYRADKEQFKSDFTAFRASVVETTKQLENEVPRFEEKPKFEVTFDHETNILTVKCTLGVYTSTRTFP